MPGGKQTTYLQRIQELEARLAESEETLSALRNGEVDAFVGTGPAGDRIYTLKGADEAYRQIVEGMSEGAVTLAVGGRILFSNSRFAALLALPLEQVIGAHIRDFIVPDFEEVVEAMCASTVDSGKEEVQMVRADASPVPAYLSWKHCQQDGLDCIFVIVTDLSGQKRNEEIVASERLARLILEQAAEAMVVAGPDGTIIRASRAADQLAGVPVLQRKFDDVFHIRRRESSERFDFHAIQAATDGGRATEHIDGMASTVDGRTVRLLLKAARVTDLDGHRLGCVITLIDVTDKERAQNELREGRERLAAALLASGTGTFRWNLRTQSASWDENLSRLFEVESNPPEGTQEFLLASLHPEDRSRLLQAVEQLTPGSQLVEDFRVLRRDGTIRWLSCTGTVYVNDGGCRTYLTGACIDITERKKATEALERINAELRRANDDLQQFAYSASHDLQEPIRNVSIYSEMVARRYQSVVDAEGLQFLEFLRQGGRRLANLVDDLLTYVRAGSLADASEIVDAAVVLGEVLADLAPAIRECDASITSSELPKVYINKAHLRQLLQNLLSNALKYRNSVAPRVHVSATTDGADWRFAVQDNGIGINPKYKETIFGVFKRLHESEKYSGTGIGLSICQRVVERYGGRIWVESGGHGGSTFFFTVPIVERSSAGASAASAGGRQPCGCATGEGGDRGGESSDKSASCEGR